jgi:hypothetical protein
MANKATLRPKPFTSENQPAKRGSRKGIPNRATVYKRILESKITEKMPDGTEAQLTVYEATALGQVLSAKAGNTNAWKEIQDSIHGKMADTLNINVSELTDEELEAIASAKG